MSGGAYDYIEFLPEKILNDVKTLEEFARSAAAYCQNDPKAQKKLSALWEHIATINSGLASIDTDFLHRVEWVASGDRSKIYD